MIGYSEFAKFQQKTRTNCHFDSFTYENGFEEEEEIYKGQSSSTLTSIQLPSTSTSTSSQSSPSLNKKYYTSAISSPTIQSKNSSSSHYHHHKKSNNLKKIIKNLLLPNKFNPLKKTTFISFLPIEITMKIISYLPFTDVISIQYVCSEWFLMTREEVLWKSIYQNYFQVFPNRELTLKKSEKSSGLHWREIFKQQHNRESKWKGDRFKEAHLIGHTGTIWCINYLEEQNNNRIFTGSFDKTAKIWDTNTKKCRFTCTGHFYPVQCLSVKDNIMVTGSLDNSIRLWDLNKGKSGGILTNRAHNFDVFCLQQIDNKIITGSSDSTVKVWDVESILNDQSNMDGNVGNGEFDEEDEEEDQVNHHQHQQQQALMNDPFAVNNSFTSLPDINQPDHVHTNIVSVNDKTSRRYLNHNLQSTHSFKHTSCVTSLQAYGNILMSGGSDRVVRVFDLNTSQPLQILTGHNEGIRALQFNGNVLVTGSDDSTVKVWDLRSGNGKNSNISTLRGHNGAVRCLQWDGTTLITGSNDQTVRWWNLNHDSSSSRELFSFNSSISCLKFNDTILMCGLSDSKVQINKFY